MRTAMVLAFAFLLASTAIAKEVDIVKVTGQVEYYTLDGTWFQLEPSRRNVLEKVRLGQGASMTVRDEGKTLEVNGPDSGTVKELLKRQDEKPQTTERIQPKNQ